MNFPSARALTILHININGIKNKKAELLSYLEEVRPHILCISELKCKRAPNIKGFYSFKPSHPNRPYNRGSAIYTFLIGLMLRTYHLPSPPI